MKILIAADMEGITGVTTWDHVNPGHAEYARFRKLMTADVNAAIRGACDAGATHVIVADGHWNGSNIRGHQLAKAGVLGMAGVDMIPVGDAGNAFHIGCD